MLKDRTLTPTIKVRTPFGPMYVHVEYNSHGLPCGGSISDPQKEPDAQIAKLVRALSDGMNELLERVGHGNCADAKNPGGGV